MFHKRNRLVLQRLCIGRLKRLKKQPKDQLYKIFTITNSSFVSLILKMAKHQKDTRQNRFGLNSNASIFQSNDKWDWTKIYCTFTIDMPFHSLFCALKSSLMPFSTKDPNHINMLIEQVFLEEITGKCQNNPG